MDIDKGDLISKVFLRKVIWDKREYKAHAHRNLVDKAWREIAEEIGIEEVVLRKKWKNLRDQFAVELGKFPVPTSRNPGATSQWPFFKSLMFLKDIVKPRPSSGNLVTKNKPTDEVDDGTFEQVTCDLYPYAEPTEGSEEVEGQDMSPLESQSMQQSVTTTSRQIRKRGAMNAESNQQILSTEEKKAKILGRVLDELTESSAPDCEDLMFFRTLLSHVKKIPPRMKLPFRAKVEEVVQEFAYPQSQPLPFMSSSSHS